MLRQQKSRLEARMAILEDHNRQLEAQLDRLRQLVTSENSNGTANTTNTNGTLQSRWVNNKKLSWALVCKKPLSPLNVSFSGKKQKKLPHLADLAAAANLYFRFLIIGSVLYKLINSPAKLKVNFFFDMT